MECAKCGEPAAHTLEVVTQGMAGNDTPYVVPPIALCNRHLKAGKRVIREAMKGKEKTVRLRTVVVDIPAQNCR